MSLITINSRADLEAEFERGRRQGREEALIDLALFIHKEATKYEEMEESLYLKGVYAAYEGVLSKMIKLSEVK